MVGCYDRGHPEDGINGDGFLRFVVRDLGSVREELLFYPEDQQLWQVVPAIKNPGGTIGLGEDQRHLVPCGHEGLERSGCEGRRAREYDAQGHEAALQAALRWRFLSFVRTRFCFSSDR